jgi:hypothetical protein
LGLVMMERSVIGVGNDGAKLIMDGYKGAINKHKGNNERVVDNETDIDKIMKEGWS